MDKLICKKEEREKYLSVPEASRVCRLRVWSQLRLQCGVPIVYLASDLSLCQPMTKQKDRRAKEATLVL